MIRWGGASVRTVRSKISLAWEMSNSAAVHRLIDKMYRQYTLPTLSPFHTRTSNISAGDAEPVYLLNNRSRHNAAH